MMLDVPYLDAFDNEAGLLTGVGVLVAMPLLVGLLLTLERARVEVGATTFGSATRVAIILGTTVSLICLLVVALAALYDHDV